MLAPGYQNIELKKNQIESKKGYCKEVHDEDYYSNREDMTIERVGETLVSI